MCLGISFVSQGLPCPGMIVFMFSFLSFSSEFIHCCQRFLSPNLVVGSKPEKIVSPANSVFEEGM